jgi:hypothetical protein
MTLKTIGPKENRGFLLLKLVPNLLKAAKTRGFG